MQLAATDLPPTPQIPGETSEAHDVPCLRWSLFVFFFWGGGGGRQGSGGFGRVREGQGGLRLVGGGGVGGFRT